MRNMQWPMVCQQDAIVAHEGDSLPRWAAGQAGQGGGGGEPCVRCGKGLVVLVASGGGAGRLGGEGGKQGGCVAKHLPNASPPCHCMHYASVSNRAARPWRPPTMPNPAPPPTPRPVAPPPAWTRHPRLSLQGFSHNLMHVLCFAAYNCCYPYLSYLHQNRDRWTVLG